MNLGQLKTAVRTRLGVPSSDAFFTDTVVTDLINAALHYIETEYPWPWLEKEAAVAVASGTTSYALPSGYRSTLEVLDANGFPMQKAPAKTIRLLLGAAGVPKLYDVYGTNLRLVPAATGSLSYTHLYIGGEVDLAADADLPTLPTVWHPALVEYAAYIAFRRQPGTQGEAGAALSAYEAWKEQMVREAKRYSADTGGGEVPADSAQAMAQVPAKR